jgi:hypothetical protein
MMMRRRPLARAAVGTAVVAGTATAIGARAARRENERQQADAAAYPPADPQQGQYSQGQYPPAQYAPAPSAPSPTVIEQLDALASLKERGALTQAEFDEQKRRLLA